MRDQNRAKTKVEFALGGSQMIALFAGSVVVLALIFSLGVMVGKRLGTVSGGGAAPDLLADLEKQEAAYRETRIDPASGAPNAEVAEKTPDTGNDAAAKPEPWGKEGNRAAKPAEAATAEKTEKDREADALKEKTAKEKAEKEKAAREKAEKEKAEAAKRAEAKKAEEKKAAERKRAEEEKKSAAEAEKTARKDPGGKTFALQLSAFKERKLADKYISKFKPFDKNKPYIVQADVPGKGTWYRVKIGRFDSREQAAAYKTLFESKTGLRAIIALAD